MIIQSDGLIVSFGSLMGIKEIGHMDNMRGYEFLNALKEVGGVKTFIVADREDNWYNAFLPPSALVKLVDVLSPVIYIGHSAGGYGAILHGCIAEAEAVIAFAPQTFTDGRWPRFVPHERLHEIIGEAANTKIYVIYCKDNSGDRSHAEHIAHHSNVHLIEREGGTHNVARQDVKGGRLKELIDEIRRDFRGEEE